MVINSATLADARKGFSILFKNGLGAASSQWDRIAMRAPSVGAQVDYKWLGKFPKLREWLGERTVMNLAAFGYTIKNKNYEATVEVDRNDFEDDQIGVYNAPMTELGRSATMHRDELVFDLLLDGFTQLCYDGKAFFASNHKDDRETAQSNASTKKLTEDNFDDAYAKMSAFYDQNSEPLGIRPNLLVVGPNNRKIALEIAKADRRANGATNVNAGIVDVLVAPRFGTSPKWFLLDATRSVLPLILQVRKEPEFVALDNPDDDEVFRRGKFLYGVDDRKAVGFGFWQFAYGSTGAT